MNHNKPKNFEEMQKKGWEMNKGKTHTEEHKRKISESLKGRMPKNIGLLHTKAVKFKKGQKAWNDEGLTPLSKKIRNSVEYKLWRKAVFERDDYTCRFCNQRGGRLNADHIKPFALFPELRFAIDNGRTLCEDCHKKTETYGSNSKC